MKKCPKCNRRDFALNNNFCYKDGLKLVDADRCACGNELLACDVFCPVCGLEVKNDTTNIPTNQ